MVRFTLEGPTDTCFDLLRAAGRLQYKEVQDVPPITPTIVVNWLRENTNEFGAAERIENQQKRKAPEKIEDSVAYKLASEAAQKASKNSGAVAQMLVAPIYYVLFDYFRSKKILNFQ